MSVVGGLAGGEESVLGYIPLTASPSPHRPLVTREPAWGMHTQLCCHISDKPGDRRQNGRRLEQNITSNA